MAIARNDLESIRDMALSGTGDQAVEWFDGVNPSFRELIRQSPTVVPGTEILNITRDPEHRTAEVRARISLAEATNRMGVVVPDTSTAPLSGLSIEVPFVLSDRGWGGWRLDGKRTLETSRKDATKDLVNVATP